MRSSKKIDMTQGPILKLVILFALPITLGNILQQLYSTVDTLVIGNYCGSESLAAVGTSSQPVEFLLCVFLGLGTGVSILVAQCMGGILFTLFSRPLLGFFTPDPEVLKLAILRANIVLPFTWCYAVLSAIIHYINGIGELKYPTIINILMLWAVRIPSAYLIAHFIHGYYIVAAIPISFVFGMICMLCYYAFSKRWKEIKRLAE